MALVTSSGFAHVRLTVTDITRSKAFYDQVFGWPIAIDASDSVDEPGVKDSPEKFYGGTVYQTPQGTLFGLRRLVARASMPTAPAWITSASPSPRARSSTPPPGH